MSDDALYLIWSVKHRAWWKPNSLGYTTARGEAGQYAESSARTICEDINSRYTEKDVPSVAMIPA